MYNHNLRGRMHIAHMCLLFASICFKATRGCCVNFGLLLNGRMAGSQNRPFYFSFGDFGCNILFICLSAGAGERQPLFFATISVHYASQKVALVVILFTIFEYLLLISIQAQLCSQTFIGFSFYFGNHSSSLQFSRLALLHHAYNPQL